MTVRDIIMSSAGASGAPANYIEDVFSTYLYTGNGSTQTINNGIDLAGKGGLVWIKDRNSGAKGHALFDTARGVNKKLQSQSTGAEFSSANQLTAFNAAGFDLGSDSDPNGSGTTYTSWTFRKQPKFFDVVTYTGNNTAGITRAIAHNLGSAPGMIITKCLSSDNDWYSYHRSIGATKYLSLNSTSAAATYSGTWGDTEPTTTNFYVKGSETNLNGATYVAYIFAHNAGGFGAAGTDNVISCGSASTDSGGNWTATLGYEPQWILWKSVGSGQWEMHDTMRGANLSETRRLFANLSNMEGESGGPYVYPTATGFVGVNGPGPANSSIIYIAIRRGPMKVPTSGTSVFALVSQALTSNGVITTNFPVDLVIYANRPRDLNGNYVWDRLRGSSKTAGKLLFTHTTDAEYSIGTRGIGFDGSTGIVDSYTGNSFPEVTSQQIYWNFRRAPGFFDEVCDTGTGAAHTITHNLQAVPELMIRKGRSGATLWEVYSSALANTQKLVLISATEALTDTAAWNSTTPTSTVFTVGTGVNVNTSGATYVTYLFASAPGVSKVGSYTGNGTSQTINCGFAAGARFVMIKRTDVSGDWHVWDTARGIVADNDPRLRLNSTAPEITTDDSVDPASSGFIVNQVAATNINVSGASYIYLAIA